MKGRTCPVGFEIDPKPGELKTHTEEEEEAGQIYRQVSAQGSLALRCH